MKKQIQSISSHQTSKVLACIYIAITIPFMFIGLLAFIFGAPVKSPDGQAPTNFPWLLFIFAPLIYGVFGYIFSRLGCLVYNLVAKFVGGFEFTVIDKNDF